MESDSKKEWGTPCLEKTADGSTTLYLPVLDEHYHSVKGAATEALHVYIDRGLRATRKSKIKLLEMGFGTGLNTFLSLIESQKNHTTIDYTAVELYPLSWQEIAPLGYEQLATSPSEKSLLKRIHSSSWNTPVAITSSFLLRKIQAPLQDLSLDSDFDVIYYDAFAPEKQPELWKEEIFEKLYAALSAGGILVTYCAKGEVRRRLQQAGFKVERLAGPPAGKREILRGRKEE